jgi:hypothetical protein
MTYPFAVAAVILFMLFPAQAEKPAVLTVPVTQDSLHPLRNTRWISNEILGLKTETKVYQLTKYQPRVKFAGFTVSFSDYPYFTSGYTAWCGNDCFTTVHGKYGGLPEILEIKLDSVTYRGECKNPTEYRNGQKLKFAVSYKSDTLFLRKL